MKTNMLAALAIGCAGPVLGTLAPSAAQAATVTLVNPSFESPTLPAGSSPGSVDGWEATRHDAGTQFFDLGADGFNQATATSPLPGTADGLQGLYVNSGSVYQNVGALLANTVYTLKVAAGNQPYYGGGSIGYIGLFNDPTSTALALATVSGQPASNFVDFTTTFTSGASVSGDLYVQMGITSGGQIDYDNVRLTAVAANVAAVPEPQAWIMMIGGFALVAGMLAMRNRRQMLTVAA